MSDYFDLALAQRACRLFTDESVPDDVLTRMLEAATHAPSAENLQPWVFVVVRDADRRAAIADIARRIWDGGGREYAKPHVSERLLAEVDEATRRGFGGAPVLVVVAADKRTGVSSRAVHSSIFPAVQNLLLAAASLGYGSALTTIATVTAGDLAAIVELPDDVEPMAVVPIGHPEKPLGRPKRDPVATKTHRETYGTPFG